MTKIYAIIDTETNEFIAYNSKCAWTKPGNAKNAWANANNGYGREFVRFDDQIRYQLVDLTEVYRCHEEDVK
jgi:hypothetical protein